MFALLLVFSFPAQGRITSYPGALNVHLARLSIASMLGRPTLWVIGNAVVDHLIPNTQGVSERVSWLCHGISLSRGD